MSRRKPQSNRHGPQAGKRQSAQYDKIIREHLETTLPMMIREVLKLDIVYSEEIPDDVQHTKERKPDALKKVRDASGNEYVLHVEFQVEDEQDMVYRMAEYSIMLMRRYQVPVKQYVIYLREGRPRMPTQLKLERFHYSYELIVLSEVDYRLFLKSPEPEIRMLALLGNVDNKQSRAVIEEVVQHIGEHVKTDLAVSKSFQQMRIFVQLRGSKIIQLEEVMQAVSRFFKEENDFLFQKGERIGENKGIEQGIERGKEQGIQQKSYDVVENLILELSLPDAQIARIAEVSIEFVQQVREKIGK